MLLLTEVFINVLVYTIYMNTNTNIDWDNYWFSFSSVETYKKCPRAFKYIYLDKEPVLQNEESKRGIEIHEYLEQAVKELTKQDSVGYNVDVEFLNKYPNIVSNFLELEKKRFDKFKDKELYKQNELEVTLKDKDLMLVGKLDRVYYLFDKDNGKVLLDYKTGKVKPKEEYYTQLPLYTYMYNKMFPLNTIKYWEIDFVNEKEQYFIEPITDELITKAVDAFKRDKDKIKKDTEFKCNTSPLCLWCRALHICPNREMVINRFKATAEKHKLDIRKQIKDALEYREQVLGKLPETKELIIYSKLAGTTFTGFNLLQLKVGDELKLVREPTNEHDPNAIAVYSSADKIGYIKKDLARDLHIALDNKYTVICKVETITGQDKDNQGVNISIKIIK